MDDLMGMPLAAFRGFPHIWMPALCMLAGCSTSPEPVAKACGYEVVRVFPHSAGAFTQGLAFCDGQL